MKSRAVLVAGLIALMSLGMMGMVPVANARYVSGETSVNFSSLCLFKSGVQCTFWWAGGSVNLGGTIQSYSCTWSVSGGGSQGVSLSCGKSGTSVTWQATSGGGPFSGTVYIYYTIWIN